MKALFSVLLAMLIPSVGIAAPRSKTTAPERIEVMVLGAYHFGNPGRDIHNVTVDSVLTAKRQRELDALATALLAFRPTQVAVEMESDRPDLHVSAYEAFTAETLATRSNELDQIGFRVAQRAGLKHVLGIDEQPGAGEPDYFPFDKVQASAQTHGQHAMLDGLLADSKSFSDAFGKAQSTQTIAQSLLVMNGPAMLAADKRFYFGLLRTGDRNDQPGADLNAMWFLRNAKIVSKLMQVAKPGDRIIILFGAGHSYWLRHLISETPGYRLVDPAPFLKKAGR